jgi:hypothetical protein
MSIISTYLGDKNEIIYYICFINFFLILYLLYCNFNKKEEFTASTPPATSSTPRFLNLNSNIIVHYNADNSSVVTTNGRVTTMYNIAPSTSSSSSNYNLTGYNAGSPVPEISTHNNRRMLSFLSNMKYVSFATATTSNNIGGLIAVVKASPTVTGIKGKNILFSFTSGTTTRTFSYDLTRAISYTLGGTVPAVPVVPDDEAIEKISGGQVYYNNSIVYDNADISNNTTLKKNTLILDNNNPDRLVIVYVNFKSNDFNGAFKIGNSAASSGTTGQNSFKGLIGDYILLNKTHTYEDYQAIQKYLVQKYDIKYIDSILNTNNIIAHYNVDSSDYVVGQAITILRNTLISSTPTFHLDRSSSPPLKVLSFGGRKMIAFETKTSFIKTTESSNNIGGFIAVIKMSTNTNNDWNYLFSPVSSSNSETADFSFRVNPRTPDYLINNNDIEVAHRGRIFINNSRVYDASSASGVINNNKNRSITNANTDTSSGENKLVIVYVDFRNITDNVSSITLGSRFTHWGYPRGFKGLVGDFIVLKKSHTHEDYEHIQRFLIRKYNITYITV